MQEGASDFERNFIQTVKSDVVLPAARVDTGPKPFSWKIIAVIVGVAAVILTVAIVVILMENPSDDQAGSGTEVQSVVGYWLCPDGPETWFKEDGSFVRIDKLDALVEETGRFSQNDTLVKLVIGSRKVNEEPEAIEKADVVYDLRFVNKNSAWFVDDTGEAGMLCDRFEDVELSE